MPQEIMRMITRSESLISNADALLREKPYLDEVPESGIRSIFVSDEMRADAEDFKGLLEEATGMLAAIADTLREYGVDVRSDEIQDAFGAAKSGREILRGMRRATGFLRAKAMTLR